MKKIFTTLLVICMMMVSFPTASAAAGEGAAGFELPVEGSTGYCLIDCSLRSDDSAHSSKLGTVAAGTPFRIMKEGSQYFQVEVKDGRMGWISKTYSLINLPDVLPSIRYDVTNGYDSRYTSLGIGLEGVTGNALYTGKKWNARLGYEEFQCPVLFVMAKEIAAAQASALADGNTLVIYEGFRPLATQAAVREGLQALMNKNNAVNAAVSTEPWGRNWFIAGSVSNHQKGYAIDTSLGKVLEFTETKVGDYTVKVPCSYEEYPMPTAMHELSNRAVVFAYPVDSKSSTAWRKVPLALTVTEGARLLQTYCTDAGLSPLSSEWWHFNSLNAKAETGNAGSGKFSIDCNMSIIP